MDEAKKPIYYPRKMRVGWCVAHTVTVMGVRIERFGEKASAYEGAYRMAERMNNQQADNESHNSTKK